MPNALIYLTHVPTRLARRIAAPSFRLRTATSRMLPVLALASLTACSSVNQYVPSFIQPYRADVQQGNWLTQQQIELLRPGMSREQVRFALGSPTLTSIFHSDRWDYPYRFTPGYGKTEERLFTVYFSNDKLERWEGDEQPSRQPFQQSAPQKQALPAVSAPDTPATLDGAAEPASLDPARPPSPVAAPSHPETHTDPTPSSPVAQPIPLSPPSKE